MTVHSGRRTGSPAMHWVTLLIGLAVLLDVLWIGSRLHQPAHAAPGLAGPHEVASADVGGKSGPPSLHMHTVF